MVAVLQYTTIIKIGAQRAQRSLFAQPSLGGTGNFNGMQIFPNNSKGILSHMSTWGR